MYFAWEFLKDLWEQEYKEIMIVGETNRVVFSLDRYMDPDSLVSYSKVNPDYAVHKNCIELMDYLLEHHQIDSAYDTFKLYLAEDPCESYFELFYEGLSMGSWYVDDAVEFDAIRLEDYPNYIRCYRELG